MEKKIKSVLRVEASREVLPENVDGSVKLRIEFQDAATIYQSYLLNINHLDMALGLNEVCGVIENDAQRQCLTKIEAEAFKIYMHESGSLIDAYDGIREVWKYYSEKGDVVYVQRTDSIRTVLENRSCFISSSDNVRTRIISLGINQYYFLKTLEEETREGIANIDRIIYPGKGQASQLKAIVRDMNGNKKIIISPAMCFRTLTGKLIDEINDYRQFRLLKRVLRNAGVLFWKSSIASFDQEARLIHS